MREVLQVVVVMVGLLISAVPSSVKGTTLPFSSEGSGPFTVTPVGPTTLREDQTVTFAFVFPFSLTSGVFQGFVNLTIPTFPERVFSTSFTLSNAGGDELFGTYTVDTSKFTDPVNPILGDFIGSEDFMGRFAFTGGTGIYAGATGGGTYVGHSEYTGVDPLALFSGFSTLVSTGTVSIVPEPSTFFLLLLGFATLVVNLKRSEVASQRSDDADRNLPVNPTLARG